MSYPLKTSGDNWLEKAIELYEKRISISIIDDAKYNLNANSDVIKIFQRYTLPKNSIFFLIPFYFLSLVCMVLLYYSFSLHYIKYLGIILSTFFLILCAVIPTYYLIKNRAPKIKKTEQGIDIVFSKQQEDNSFA